LEGEEWLSAVKDEADYDKIMARSQSKPTLDERSLAIRSAPFTSENVTVPVYYCREFFRGEADDIALPAFDGADLVLVDRARFITKLSAVPLDEQEADNSYCLFLPVQAMKPALPVGEPVLVNTARPSGEQDLALVYLKTEAGAVTKGEVAIPAQVTRVHPGGYDLEQFNGARFTIDAEQVGHVDRIYVMPDFLR